MDIAWECWEFELMEVGYGLGNQSELSEWRAAGEASHPPTWVGYQS